MLRSQTKNHVPLRAVISAGGRFFLGNMLRPKLVDEKARNIINEEINVVINPKAKNEDNIYFWFCSI